jgi:hypothetical protein
MDFAAFYESYAERKSAEKDGVPRDLHLIFLTELFAMELEGCSIRIQALAPCFVESRFHDAVKNVQAQASGKMFVNERRRGKNLTQRGDATWIP